jgi:hypothetical protein
MLNLLGMITYNKIIQWQFIGRPESVEAEEDISIRFNGGWPGLRKRRTSYLQEILNDNKVEWLWLEGRTWYLNLAGVRQRFDIFKNQTWMEGIVRFEQKLSATEQDQERREFLVFREGFLLDKNQRIFLCHKGANKPLVRRFFKVLKTLGFEPWLDEEDMPAGKELHRAILEGFERSCAAVFFLTPQFKDENYLRGEINYAIDEKRKKGDRFAIVSLAFGSPNIVVPGLLKPYVYKTVKKQLDGLREIIRALPIEVGTPRWRPEIGKDVPDIEHISSQEPEIHFRKHDVFFRYKGRDASGGGCPADRADAILVGYWFVANFFNTHHENVGLTDITLAFLKDGQLLHEVVPGKHTGKVRAGVIHFPEVHSLTLPSKDWVEVTFEGAISPVEKLDGCNEMVFKAKTVDGKFLSWPLENKIIGKS